MPEGDTIFRTARTLHLALAGKPVVRFEARTAGLASADDDDPVEGRRVERVDAVGKHCLVRFSGELVLRTHLRMSGAWHVYRPGERWQLSASRVRVLVAVPDFVAVGFDVPVAELVSEDRLARDGPLRHLGPDLLAADFDPDEALRRLRARSRWPLGEALLDQHALAGIGNVYRSEILHIEGIHPETLVSELDDGTLRRVLATARRLLLANVSASRAGVPRSYAGVRRTTVVPSASLFVYGRRGEPCLGCGGAIALRRLGRDARVVFFCPRCQPERREGASEAPSLLR